MHCLLCFVCSGQKADLQEEQGAEENKQLYQTSYLCLNSDCQLGIVMAMLWRERPRTPVGSGNQDQEYL